MSVKRSNTFDVGKGESGDHESSLDEMDESIADLSLSVIKAPDSEVDMSHQVTLTIDEFHDGVSQFSEEQSSFRFAFLFSFSDLISKSLYLSSYFLSHYYVVKVVGVCVSLFENIH